MSSSIESDKFDNKFVWLNDPTLYSVSSDDSAVEGYGGSFTKTDDDCTLIINAPSKKDFWSRTFYEPELIKNDASALVLPIALDEEATVAVDFSLTPKEQFDQAGLLVYIDDLHWIKCGIEYCDGSARLSVVVCNNYSDWSTQPWSVAHNDSNEIVTGARLKVHKIIHNDSVVVEAAPLNSDNFQFIRIAHCSVKSTHTSIEHSLPTDVKWCVGPYAACPTKQAGCVSRFSNFSCGPRQNTVHESNL